MLLRHSFFYLLARGVPGLVSFFSIALYTRLLYPDEYGRYTMVVAGVGMANAILFQWLRLGLLRYLPVYQEQRKEFLSSLSSGFIVLAALTGAAGLGLSFLWPDRSLQGLILLGTALLWAQAWFELNLELARTQLSPQLYGKLMLAKALVALAVGGTLAYCGLGAAGLLLGMLAGFFLPVLRTTRTEWSGVRWSSSDRAIFRRLLTYGLPLTAAFALDYVVSSSDRFILGWLAGAGVTGLYAVGYDLAKQSLLVPMMTVNLASYPLAVRALEQEGRGGAQRQLIQNTTVLFAIALPAAVGLSMLAPNITGVFLGAEYIQAATSLIPWVTAASLCAGIKAYYFDLSFQLGQRTVGQVWVLLVSALINVGLNIWWIPLFGFMGAAYATLVAYAVGMVISAYLGRRIFPLPFPGKEIAKIALSATGMALALWPALPYRGGMALVGQIGWGVLVYLALLLLLDAAGLRGKTVKLLKATRKAQC
ncbi:MAG TPA: oligosaccharide flippase family protein [Firmicutes bacterium]|nr:oligosaccharide flippase family protein [Bacillota bacterium]